MSEEVSITEQLNLRITTYDKDRVKTIVSLGRYSNISDFVREAIRRLLRVEELH